MNFSRYHSPFKIANAPCSWGVEDPQNPDNPHWKTVLDEAAKAGYQGLELGPYGFMPTDAMLLRDELGQRNLSVCAGTLFEPFWDKDRLPYILQKTHNLCRLLHSIGSKYLVIIDEVNDLRSSYAGRKNDAPRLIAPEWECMISTISQIARIAREAYGLQPVLHPHAGGYIEYDDEVIRALDDLDPDNIALCLDTGHCVYSGMDPVEWLKKYSDRLAYVHFKDVHADRLENCINNKTGFWEACKQGVMCPIGDGCVDYLKIKQTLEEINYQGWIVIEQERDPLLANTSLADVSKSLTYLNKSGFSQ